LNSNLRCKKFEELKLPFYVNCARLKDGKNVFFDSGDLIRPIVASCSIPPILAPVKIGDEYYMDGGIGSHIEVDLLRKKNYRKIVIISQQGNRALRQKRHCGNQAQA